MADSTLETSRVKFATLMERPQTTQGHGPMQIPGGVHQFGERFLTEGRRSGAFHEQFSGLTAIPIVRMLLQFRQFHITHRSEIHFHRLVSCRP